MVPLTTLYITRGLPGSGKSTWARKWVSEDPKHRAEVNRDHLRVMMHGGYADAEVQVTAASHAAIRDLLKQGVSVVCSDTNLPQRHARDLAKLGRLAGAGVEITDLTDVPLETCIERNAQRCMALGDDKDPVPEDVIRDMHRRYVAGNGYPLPLPVEDSATGNPDLVEFDPDLPTVVICDIDGTVAKMNGRSPYDYTRVSEDLPNQPVIDVLNQLFCNGNGYGVVFLSGRMNNCYLDTQDWLEHHTGVWKYQLFMRRARDNRKDSIVKRELFDQHIRGKYNVLCVLDDRAQVVKMWREELGLTCLQVAEGNF